MSNVLVMFQADTEGIEQMALPLASARSRLRQTSGCVGSRLRNT